MIRATTDSSGDEFVRTPMTLATLRLPSTTRAAVRTGDAFAVLPAEDVGALLAERDWREIASRAAAHAGETVAVDDADYAPVVTAPRKVLCCGHNYRGHITELGRPMPRYPTIFAKFADTLTGAHDDIVLDDAVADGLDWEAELAVIIGATIRKANADVARSAIAGYAVANDISVREWQHHTGQWLPGKAFDATTPLGPVLVTTDEFRPSEGHGIRCTVNDVEVQKADVDDLLFDAADLVSYLSTFTTLRPGDVVLTGTPAGVGAAATPPRQLNHGDVVVTEIDGLGRCENRIVVLPSTTDT